MAYFLRKRKLRCKREMTSLFWRPRCRRPSAYRRAPPVRECQRRACLRHAPWSVLALDLFTHAIEVDIGLGAVGELDAWRQPVETGKEIATEVCLSRWVDRKEKGFGTELLRLAQWHAGADAIALGLRRRCTHRLALAGMATDDQCPSTQIRAVFQDERGDGNFWNAAAENHPVRCKMCESSMSASACFACMGMMASPVASGIDRQENASSVEAPG